MPPRASLSALAFLSTTALVYAGLRAYDVVFGREANPATVLYVYDEHIALFWRLAIAAFAGGAVALLCAALSARHPARVARAVTGALPVIALIVAVQALVLP